MFLVSASLHYVQEDATVIPKAAIITVSGLGGLVAGYRGTCNYDCASYGVITEYLYTFLIFHVTVSEGFLNK